MIRAQARRLAKWAVPSAATVVLLLVSTEEGVRILGLAPSLPLSHYTTDPSFPFKTRPLARTAGRSATAEYDYDYRHNSFGFRDIERSPRKPKDVFRILAMGDSFTYGAGVPFEATFLSRLERMLNARRAVCLLAVCRQLMAERRVSVRVPLVCWRDPSFAGERNAEEEDEGGHVDYH